MFIKIFQQLSASDADIAGGKGASLGEMIGAGILVPEGFVVTAEAFEKFLEETDLNVEIDAILKTVDTQKMHTVESASEKIQALILEAKMPADIAIEIEKEFKNLNTSLVAVRSSATAEDGAEAAWAGQLNSYLNTAKASLLKNVQKCWASLFTPRAIFYRFEKGLHSTHISVAVVVQKMIQSEKSGIAFSVHPVTEDHNQLIIEAGWGLGEAIVSGSVTPDSYVVEKEPRNILDINVATQTKGLFAKVDGGNKWRDIPEPKASSQVLSEKEILELAELILKIEKHYGFPCDIEWAQEGGKFYITQSRPITTLMEKKADRKEEYVKIFNRSLFLMGCQNYDLGERVEMEKITPVRYFMDPILHNLPGRGTDVYYNFTDSKQDPKLIAEYFNGNREELLKLKKEYCANCDLLRILIFDLKHDDYRKLFNLTIKIWPLIALSNMLGDNRDNIKGVDSDLLELYREMRKYSDGLIQNSHLRIAEILKKVVPEKYKKYHKYLKYEEVVNGDYPTIEELKERQKGFIFHKGKLFTGISLDDYAQKNNYEFIGFKANNNLSENSISGQIAYEGKAKGYVRIIFEVEDMDRVNEGDILVTSMTTPDFLPAMNLASAFVTDEGGITCHASIVAREIKKPCIIGTKIATQVLKEGDLVEVDADNRVVRILKKAE